MKVLVIGATGGTGQRAVAKLLEAGHQLTALVRRPEAMTAAHDRLTVVQGDARDAAAITRATAGQDAVLATFGPRSLKKDNLQETLMRNILAGMAQHRVKRLVNLSAWGSLASRNSAPLPFKIIRGTLLRAIFEDKDRGEALLLASDLDFVNVSPGRLTDGPERKAIKVTLNGKGVSAAISRADVAQFMVDQLGANQWLRQSPIIGY